MNTNMTGFGWFFKNLRESSLSIGRVNYKIRLQFAEDYSTCISKLRWVNKFEEHIFP